MGLLVDACSDRASKSIIHSEVPKFSIISQIISRDPEVIGDDVEYTVYGAHVEISLMFVKMLQFVEVERYGRRTLPITY